MSTTIMYGDESAYSTDEAVRAGQSLLLSPTDFAAATGWQLKPQGLCRDEACVPLPRDGSWVDAEGRIDLVAFAGHFRRPLVHDDDHDVWVVGQRSDDRFDQLNSLVAPDFTLPGLDGRMHSLSDYRGKKVFLHSWGSS